LTISQFRAPGTAVNIGVGMQQLERPRTRLRERERLADHPGYVVQKRNFALDGFDGETAVRMLSFKLEPYHAG
jgi:hypothetical protein